MDRWNDNTLLSPNGLKEWKKGVDHGFFHDNECNACEYGGEVLICEAPEGCTKVYHRECLTNPPPPNSTTPWICPDHPSWLDEPWVDQFLPDENGNLKDVTPFEKKPIAGPCDQCQQTHRHKCERAIPCDHCLLDGKHCTYVRPIGRRGRPPLKDITNSHPPMKKAKTATSTPSPMSSLTDDASYQSIIDLTDDNTIKPNEAIIAINASTSSLHIFRVLSYDPSYPSSQKKQALFSGIMVEPLECIDTIDKHGKPHRDLSSFFGSTGKKEHLHPNVFLYPDMSFPMTVVEERQDGTTIFSLGKALPDWYCQHGHKYSTMLPSYEAFTHGPSLDKPVRRIVFDLYIKRGQF